MTRPFLVRTHFDSSGGGFTPYDFTWGGSLRIERKPYFLSFGIHVDWRTKELVIYFANLMLDLGKVVYRGERRFILHIVTRGQNGTDRWNRTNEV